MIEKRIKNYLQGATAAKNPIDGNADYYQGKIDACKDILEFLKEEEQSKGLDEAAEKYVVKAGLQPESFIVIPSFRAGAEWMAGQFQKIEGELVDWYSTSDGKDYCCGVKTIDSFEVPEGFYVRKKQ